MKKSWVLLLLLGMLLGASSALAAIDVGNSSNITVIPAPPVLTTDTIENDTNVFIYAEAQDVVGPEAFPYDCLFYVSSNLGSQCVSKTMVLDSYVVFADAVGCCDNQPAFQATITFDEEVLGWEDVYGQFGNFFSSPTQIGAVPSGVPAAVTLSTDRHTVTISWQNPGYIQAFRILTTDLGSTVVDNDQDTYSPPEDCDDNNAAIHPGATDVAGNGVDEDCSGADTPVTVEVITQTIQTCTSDAGVQQSLTAALNGARQGFIYLVQAQSGKKLTQECAAELTRLVNGLPQ